MERLIKINNDDWLHPDAFDDGIDQIVLFNTLNEQEKTGSRTRIVKFSAGAMTKVPFIHDYEEEVLLFEGDQGLLDKDTLLPIQSYEAKTFFIRPAGTWHGPFSSKAGCLLLEYHYY
ncbi:cupin [Polynucleobacter sp. JS-Safj-400b-B2]|uniref:cupin n=1 Tax=Polynucleobacter sp. JS-Safj-400b-B2 TaxID=2576921 RepID=UPI001C0D6A8D|nr:cupin [Polynucleobacter sp. JS-Safj-400b-B2]MBU3627231.1 cupin [Polynucleobacter sp. JS-Safj-400b-B2]